MVLKINFDASFKPEINTSGISVVIKNEDGVIILKSSRRILCNTSSEAEFRALNKAIGYINNRQSKNLLPMNCLIKIYGDSQSVIEISKRMHKMRGIDKGLMLGFIKELQSLNKNNIVKFNWIPRKNNVEAHHESKNILLLNT